VRKATLCVTLLALCALVFSAGTAGAAIIMIDDFQNPGVAPPTFTHWMEQYIVGFGDVYANPNADAGLPFTSTLGGERAFELIYEGGGGNGSSADMRLIGSPDQNLDLSTNGGVAAEFDVGYGWTTPLSADFSGLDTIQIGFLSPDHDSQFIVELVSNLETTPAIASAVYSLPNGYAGAFNVSLSDFPGIDLTDVDQIGFAFGFESTTGLDDEGATYVADLQMRVDYIRAVSTIPEPCTLTLLGLGLLATLRRKRSRR